MIEKLPAPSLATQALFGEPGGIVRGSMRLEPLATQASGFRLHFDTVEQALDDLLAPLGGGVRRYQRSVGIPADGFPSLDLLERWQER